MVLVINDESSAEEIKQGIRALRAKQQRCRVESMRVEIGDEIDELLEMLTERCS